MPSYLSWPLSTAVVSVAVVIVVAAYKVEKKHFFDICFALVVSLKYKKNEVFNEMGLDCFKFGNL